MFETKCILRSCENLHEPIVLNNCKEVILGRGPETKIKESRCSRNQVKLVADFEKRTVEITQVGRNCCGVNGLATRKDQPVVAKNGDKIEVLLGQFGYIIEFTGGDEPKNTSDDVQQQPSSTISGPSTSMNLSDSDDEEPLSKRAEKSSGETKRQSWVEHDNGKCLIYTSKNVKSSKLIAAYDLDNTLITTNSGSVFPKNENDWKILYREIPAKLKELERLNYKFLIFTNQAGLASGKLNLQAFQRKIENVVKKLNVPVQVFVSTGLSIYRKPCTGMWELAVKKNGSEKINLSRSFYCGDAAGRDASNSKKKDFSQSDLLFAKNIDLHFVTPEHHFLKKKTEVLKITAFDPSQIRNDIPLCQPEWGVVVSNKLELVLLVGSPGSGKTHFYKTHMEPAGYVHVNRDTLGSMSKCLSLAEQSLQEKRSVVIDNTNPDVESRKKFIALAKSHTSIVRCFIMNTTLPHAKHNNKFRELTDSSHTTITDYVINCYVQKYEEPTLTEGFSEILKINFWLIEKSEKLSQFYKMFLVEK